MKVRISFAIIISIMTIINSIFLIPDIKEFFWGGSNYIFAKYFVLNGIYPFLITLGMLIHFFILRKFNKSLICTILITILIWIHSGRIVGVEIHDNNCEIISGWFYIGTNYINTSKAIKDKDDNCLNKLKFKELSLWRLKVEKGNFNEIIYIGPFLWKDLKSQIDRKP
ncbi:hypothetical protein ACFSJW_24645 [Flavobacterium artemisiae]|uniref:Uncharacterized protein n=1 Tax=Flavobacterium artemisiae TaxID=2126556 RepID=A0ABW4HA40_9FLAO